MGAQALCENQDPGQRHPEVALRETYSNLLPVDSSALTTRAHACSQTHASPCPMSPIQMELFLPFLMVGCVHLCTAMNVLGLDSGGSRI